jgi:hypothetical protein
LQWNWSEGKYSGIVGKTIFVALGSKEAHLNRE